MADRNEVYLTGLTFAEAQNLHANVINGVRIFDPAVELAYFPAYVLTRLH